MSRNSNETEFNNILTDMFFTILLEYDNLNDFLELSSTLSEREKLNVAEKIKDWDTKNPQNTFTGSDVYESDFYKVLNYEKEINYAVILLAYAKFETVLNRICMTIGKEKGFNIQVQDIAGKGIHRSRKYLEKMFQLDFTKLNNTWNIIKMYSELRNIIVHNYGEIIVKDGEHIHNTEAYKKISKLTGIMITENTFIKISNETIVEFIRITDGFLNKILDKLKDC